MGDVDGLGWYEANPGETVESARERIFIHRNDPQGVECPCCSRLVKRYRRTLTSSAALFVLHLVNFHKQRSNEEWVNIKSFNVRGGDYAKSTYWSLASSMPNTNPATRCSGWWKATEAGMAFVELKLKVPRFALVYAGKVEGYCGPTIDIVEALGAKFNYTELMACGA